MTKLVKFNQDAWEGFLFEHGFNFGDDANNYKELVEFIKTQNGNHVRKEAKIIFDTEEDALVFKLKFGL